MINVGKLSRRIKDRIRPMLMPRVAAQISSRFRSLSRRDLATLEAALRQHYFSSRASFSTPEGQALLETHLSGRLENFRRTVVPWLSHTRSLQGLNVLEIGCGTGSSTVALAEQGANVTAVDIEQKSLIVALERCRLFGLDIHFKKANADEVHRIFAGQHFDLVIFFAVLEHMLPGERLSAMKTTWDMLERDDLWCLVDTPNRLWFFDGHTSSLPFFFWLPDDLAMQYAKFSPRKNFNLRYNRIGRDSGSDLLRQGRGISYHEFTLTMGQAEDLNILSSLALFLRARNILRKILWKFSIESRHESLLVKVGPRLHRGFYQQSLDLIIKKT